MTENNSMPADGQRPGVLEFDSARYDAALGPLDISDEQRVELLGTLWSIMQNMVELGYSIADSKICESILGPFIEATNSPTGTIESSHNDKVNNEKD
jgi:hypothetical protein